MTVDILHDDGDLIAVNKPSGVVVHRGWNGADRPMLQRVRDHVGAYVYLVHRLDRATSGVLLFTRRQTSASELGQRLEAGSFRKEYVALVRGHLGRRNPAALTASGMLIDHPVPRTEHGARIEAQTTVWCLAESQNERCSLVRAQPHTGRLHQIRRHLKHLAHPVVGDVRYGDGRVNRHFRDNYDLHRLWLHATSLEVPLGEGKSLMVTAPLGPDLRDGLERLGLTDVL